MAFVESDGPTAGEDDETDDSVADAAALVGEVRVVDVTRRDELQADRMVASIERWAQ